MVSYSIVVLIMSLLTFMIYGLDKYKAIKHLRRVSEKALLILSLCFGATGAIFGMIIFRHKSNKIKFKFFNMLFFIMHALIALYLYNQG